MDGVLIGILVVLLLGGGSICGLIAMSRASALEQDLRKLRQQLQRLENRLTAREQAEAARMEPATPELPPVATPSPSSQQSEQNASLASSMAASAPTVQSAPLGSENSTQTAEADASMRREASAPADTVAPTPAPTPAPARQASRPAAEQLERDLASRWMVWVGGLALALGGIFLVKFGVEHSVLGPTGRLVAAGILGLGLVLGSEWLRRRDLRLSLPRLGQQADYVPAAMAGGGVIAWYASLLMAFNYYGFMAPGVAFVLLALVSLLALGLSLLQGPLLAVLGLLGGYLVPVLVSTGQGSLPGLLGYVALVSLAALALQFHVQRRWLWWGTLLGHFAWFLLAWTLYRDESGFVVGYLLASLYAFIALP